MNPPFPLATDQRVLYPDSDGEPIGENTLQFRWIVTIQGNLDAWFARDEQVFVAGDLFWYPVRGQPKIVTAPDVLVVFGRPKRERLSYLQWQEEQIAPQVVWEILSTSNRAREMALKLEFYDRYGVEEYYLYDPDALVCRGWRRVAGGLVELESLAGWVSPRQGVRFELSEDGLELYHPDGRRFLTYLELAHQLAAEQVRADLETERADAESRRADAEAKRAARETKRAAKLAAKLRSLGIDPEES